MPTSDDSPPTAIDLRRGVLQVLEGLQAAGVEQWKRPRVTAGTSAAKPVAPAPTHAPPVTPPSAPPLVAPKPVQAEPPRPVAPPPARETPVSQPRPAVTPVSASINEEEMAKGPDSGRVRALTILKKEVAGCTACPELVANRTQTVFGVGNVRPRLVFFGEAPGADEDRQGEPFVGAAGQLLNDIITKGMKLQRSDVYILNVLKCRPPSNRPPDPTEAANCGHFWRKQLEILQPEFVCCLGLHAAQQILNVKTSVGKLRGQFHEYGDIKVLVTYHPAYLLRNPPAKKDVWADIKILMREMGLPTD